jgi:hypothetical protein
MADVSSKGKEMKRAVLAILSLAACPLIYAEDMDGDFVAEVSKKLPAGWSTGIRTFQGKCFVDVLTSAMESDASRYGQAAPGVEKKRLTISIQLMPRYSKPMLKRIQALNKPIKAKLESLNYYSQEYSAVASKVMDEPMFYDDTYGFRIRYPSRIPKAVEDRQKFVTFLMNISEGWKSYDPRTPNVKDELVRILTR